MILNGRDSCSTSSKEVEKTLIYPLLIISKFKQKNHFSDHQAIDKIIWM